MSSGDGPWFVHERCSSAWIWSSQVAKDEVNEGANELVFWRRPYRAECRIWKDNSRTRMRVEVRTEILSDGSEPAPAAPAEAAAEGS